MYGKAVFRDGCYFADVSEPLLAVGSIVVRGTYDDERPGRPRRKPSGHLRLNAFREFRGNVEALTTCMWPASPIGQGTADSLVGLLQRDEVVVRMQEGWPYRTKSNIIPVQPKNALRSKKIHT
jgi:hypothetical protein